MADPHLDVRPFGDKRVVVLAQHPPDLLAAMNSLQDEEGKLLADKLAELGLSSLLAVEDLDSLLDSFRSKGMNVTASVSAFPQDGPLKRVFLAHIREGLNNVHKHSGQQQAWFSVDCTPSLWILKLWDRGHGFSGSGNGSGFGRQSLAWQTHSVGGRLQIRSTDRGGGDAARGRALIGS